MIQCNLCAFLCYLVQLWTDCQCVLYSGLIVPYPNPVPGIVEDPTEFLQTIYYRLTATDEVILVVEAGVVFMIDGYGDVSKVIVVDTVWDHQTQVFQPLLPLLMVDAPVGIFPDVETNHPYRREYPLLDFHRVLLFSYRPGRPSR